MFMSPFYAPLRSPPSAAVRGSARAWVRLPQWQWLLFSSWCTSKLLLKLLPEGYVKNSSYRSLYSRCSLPRKRMPGSDFLFSQLGSSSENAKDCVDDRRHGSSKKLDAADRRAHRMKALKRSRMRAGLGNSGVRANQAIYNNARPVMVEQSGQYTFAPERERKLGGQVERDRTPENENSAQENANSGSNSDMGGSGMDMTALSRRERRKQNCSSEENWNETDDPSSSNPASRTMSPCLPEQNGSGESVNAAVAPTDGKRSGVKIKGSGRTRGKGGKPVENCKKSPVETRRNEDPRSSSEDRG
mmetsp:Transcript_12318/g.50688  ORF Transcript_12318/g.50688 Transcript_12318/m.50688 type:complete len:302 (-) Transcript_12318:462-1367(-)